MRYNIYNKVVERLNGYEELLLRRLEIFELEGLVIVESRPIEAKRLVRFGRYRKNEISTIIREERIGVNPLKGDSTWDTRQHATHTTGI